MTTDWKTLSISDIEQRYDQAVYAPNAREIVQWYTDESQRVQAALAGTRFQYGANSTEYGYWFKAAQPQRDIVVFIHGGAWKVGRAEDYLFPAQWLTRAEFDFVCLNFDNTPVTGGQLFPMLHQLITAISWLSRQLKQANNPARIHIASHSSGSHLAACLAGLDWEALLPDTPELINSVLLCSGIYDLAPVAYSKRREYLKLGPVEIHALSPLRHTTNKNLKIGIIRGELESPEFIRQHDEYAQKLKNEKISIQTRAGAGLNHFEILQTFANAKGLMATTFIDLVSA